MYTIDEHDKIKALIEALRQKEHDVFWYQVNIDNYRIAIEMAPSDMGEYQEKLAELLDTELKEQAKSQLILNAILKQLENENIQELLKDKDDVVCPTE